MAKYSRIEWTDATWSPVTGCAPISEGCQNCYAKRMANRLRGRCGYPADEPFKVTLHKDRLEEPLRLKKPRRVFVCSMGDLFHEDVPFEFIASVFGVMANSSQNTYMVLTKRPQRMKEFFDWLYLSAASYYARDHRTVPYDDDRINVFIMKIASEYGINLDFMRKWPLFNVWLGVTAENQARADERIPILLQIPAAVRFVSCEPLLSAIDLTKWIGGKNQNDGCREIILCSDGNRSVQYFANRRDLETQGTSWKRQGCEIKVEGYPNKESRNITKSRSFTHSNDREWQESNGLCSSCSMDVLQQGRNTGSFGDKPQRRESKEQSSRQLGVGDQEREYLACGAGVEALGQEGTERGEEFKCKTYSPTGYRNTVDLEEPRDVLITNSGTLQSVCDDNTGYLSLQDVEASYQGIDWCIVGGETGPGARPMHPDWVRSLRDQCQDARVPFFFKQHGEWLHETQGINFHEGHRYYVWPDESMSFRVGKKAAGRLLDGRTWDEMPEI